MSDVETRDTAEADHKEDTGEKRARHSMQDIQEGTSHAADEKETHDEVGNTLLMYFDRLDLFAVVDHKIRPWRTVFLFFANRKRSVVFG